MNKGYYSRYKKFVVMDNKKGLTAPKKLGVVKKILGKHISRDSAIRIADFGGVSGSYIFFKREFPNSEIWTINIVKEQMGGCEKVVLEDITKKTSLKSNYFDLVFSGDTIEHIIDPDDVVVEMKRVLKKNGLLVITTPNLASLYNRISLLFGFAPSNYHPSSFRHGSLFGVKKASWHKSVFTIGAMKGFLKQHGFREIKFRGYSYGGSRYSKILDNFLTIGLKEGMVVIAKK